MDEEMKKELQQMLDSFKASLPQLKDVQSVENAFNAFKSEVKGQFDSFVSAEDFKELQAACKTQGETIAAMKLQGEKKVKSVREQLIEKQDVLNKLASGELKQFSFGTTQKDILSSSFEDNTLGYREPGVGQIQRGMPFIADLFPRVIVGSNSGGVARWAEQASITNNAGAVTEGNATASQSAMTWIEKSLEGKRIMDYAKIGVDMVKDVDFVLGEIQNLVSNNLKLAENDALINGDGTGANINGVLTYATAFDTTGIQIVEPNIVDLVNRCSLQVTMGMKGGAAATNFVGCPVDIQPLKEAKDANGRYIFEAWALGQNPSIGGVNFVSNPLVTQNTMIVGDFSKGTLFVFDDLLIELIRINDDELKGLITIRAYKRENLRVKDVDKKAFIKVASISDTLDAINKVQA